MSRINEWGDYDEEFPNAYDLFAANAHRALRGRRGRKALRELRAALLALPEKRLISGALCTVGGVDKRAVSGDPYGYYRSELEERVKEDGEGVCAIGAYIWRQKVKAGADPQAAFAELPTILGNIDDCASVDTAYAGKRAGLTFALAWSLVVRNDQTYGRMTPEQRYAAFMEWIVLELKEDEAA